MDLHAAISGWGWYSPEKILTNGDLEHLIDTDDAWIRSRTGISQRHILAEHETTSSMGLLAAQQAIHEAGLSPRDIDLVICATTTPDYLLPVTACLIQQSLGADRAAAFDLNTACSGFIYGIAVGSQFIQAGTSKRVLVVASEALSRFVNWHDRNTCILFGDGAAAVVLEATAQNAGVLSTVLGSRGDIEKLLLIEAGGSAMPASQQTIDEQSHLIRMRGNEVFKMAVRSMVTAAQEALVKAGLSLKDIRAVIPHQANQRIITAMQEALGVEDDRMFVNVDRHGNTGAASIPIALGEYLLHNPADTGDHFLFVAFGGGLTWGAAVLRWADIAALRRERQSGMPHTLKLAMTG